MKKIVLGVGSVLAVILIISIWWRYTYCREISVFKNEEDKYAITSLMYWGKDIDIKNIDTNLIDNLLCDIKCTRTYNSFYSCSEKEYPLNIDYRKEFQDLINIRCGKEGMFCAFGTDPDKTYSIVNGEQIAADLLKIIESASESN